MIWQLLHVVTFLVCIFLVIQKREKVLWTLEKGLTNNWIQMTFANFQMSNAYFCIWTFPIFLSHTFISIWLLLNFKFYWGSWARAALTVHVFNSCYSIDCYWTELQETKSFKKGKVFDQVQHVKLHARDSTNKEARLRSNEESRKNEKMVVYPSVCFSLFWLCCYLEHQDIFVTEYAPPPFCVYPWFSIVSQISLLRS